MLLLTDLVETPGSAYATYSRQMIDLIFALLGPSGGVVASFMKRPLINGGHESWKYLWQLRRKAWQKCRMDPDDLWTREQAVLFCKNQELAHRSEIRPHSSWNQASPQDMEQFSGLEISPDSQMVGDVMTPSIDWEYLDTILAEGFGEASGEDS